MSELVTVLLFWISFDLLLAALFIWRRVIAMPRGSNRIVGLRVIDYTAWTRAAFQKDRKNTSFGR
jgi:hypothetical protein